MERILLVKGIAGLGNRVLCLLTASLYSRLSGRRLVVDWRDPNYSTGGINAFHHFFVSSLAAPTDAVPETDSVAPAIWRHHLDESAWSMKVRYGSVNDAQGWRRFSIDLGRTDYPERVAVLWTYTDELDPLRPHLDITEPLTASSRSAILRKLLSETLSLHPRIVEKIDRFKQQHFRRRMVAWWREHNIRGIFGFEHAHVDSSKKVVAIRWPLWLGACNSFYSKRLLQEHEGFRIDCGPIGHRYRIAEDVELNVRLECAGVSIYYV